MLTSLKGWRTFLVGLGLIYWWSVRTWDAGDQASDWLDRRWKTLRKRGGKDPTAHGARICRTPIERSAQRQQVAVG